MPTTPPDDLSALVTQALSSVIDPELGRNIVDLGLVYFVAVDAAGAAHVVMTTTAPGCPAVGYLTEGARRAAASVPGVASAEVAVTYDPPWTPDRIAAGANTQPERSAKRPSWMPWRRTACLKSGQPR